MRKPRHEEHVDSEKWAIPYADLMTLLLAFFVVMYSLSQINESKYRVLAESINEAFNGTGKVIEPIAPAQPARQVPLPDQARAANASPISQIAVPVAPRNLPVPGHEGAAADASQGKDAHAVDAGNPGNGAAVSPGNGAQAANLKTISTDVAKALKPWVDANQVVIRETRLWLEIEIRTDVLFPSGVAQLTDSAQKVLDDVAGVLGRFPNPIRVEGYTDDRPINTWRFPSNWELSAARAGSVARLFGDHGVDPSQIAIFGWGEYHPVASNDTPEGRNRNRRIAIVVLGGQATQRRDYGDDRQTADVASAPTHAADKPGSTPTGSTAPGASAHTPR
ncbi:MAG: flagellar motor protein MotD [Xanthomonadales bacterium]|nr:flagellar motor protein MotD [Xanthomonadales bacterium]ODU95302.1 MAG: hypothetical protein ABT18_00825 [Rhodanobacter sp. SCN 66-43]OJY83028.1 MAG: hypothetical protein BGP23_08130 [Xanthomonadales bacterium 66-474]